MKMTSQSDDLSSLGITIVDQQCLEEKVEKAIDKAVAEHAHKQHISILKKEENDARKEIKKLLQKKEDLHLRLSSMKQRVTDPRLVLNIEKEIKENEELIFQSEEKQQELETQIENKNDSEVSKIMEDMETKEQKESQDKIANLIKSGEMTPFGTVTQYAHRKYIELPGTSLPMPAFSKKSTLNFETYLNDQMERQKTVPKRQKPIFEDKDETKQSHELQEDCESDYGSDYYPSEASDVDELEYEVGEDESEETVKPMKKEVDDANMEEYRKRVKVWKKQRLKRVQDGDEDVEIKLESIVDDFKVPKCTWNSLYKYQKTGVRWLWELHSQGCGGILGDEMGLGKTIQIIAFLAGLAASKLPSKYGSWKGLGPVLIICPPTVLQQWLRELHKWWPLFRVALLHSSGSFEGKKPALIHNINNCNGILLTSYSGVRESLNSLIQYRWHYVILDEGHKIRNPEAQISVSVKRIDTPHRLILSGSPIQNSLKELWSLFDFIFPGKLGTLPVFLEQFAVPITQGGYATASKLEVETAYRCATVLRDTINPFLLRRMKNDVRSHLSLPDKNEQVLFCGLSAKQRQEYKNYLQGPELSSIIKGRMRAFAGIINLRKICNHPDIFIGKRVTNQFASDLQPELGYGYWRNSGKMIVLRSILRLWSKQGHRVLLFTQSRQMVKILQKFIKNEGYKHFKMDGGTSMAARQHLIDKFNKDESVFVFLLTTRVGGLGVNLTGADRVVIYDPDWNPSTDLQARERAWRIGQVRDVTIYRLLTAGTIEEKIYHRQIFKQFITNRVLKDPKQQRFFKTNDLYELFTLSEQDKVSESSAIFAGTGSEIKVKKKKCKKGVCPKKIVNLDENDFVDEQMELKKRKNESIMDSPKKIIKLDEKEISAENQIGSDVELKKENNNSKNEINTSDEKQVQLDEKRKERMRQMAKMINCKISSENLLQSKPSVSKKKTKGKKFEGKRIDNLVKKRTMKTPDENEKDNKSQDEYVLQKLFKKTGIHSAHKHDAIVDSGDPDFLLVKAEADRIAKDALKKVRASRAQVSNPKPKIIFGSNNKIDNGSKNFNESSESGEGISSTSLLMRILQRNQSEEEIRPYVPDDENVELLNDIRHFVSFQASNSGKASSKELVKKFSKLPSSKTLLFKTLLTQICYKSNGYWHLNVEFR